MPDFCSCGAQLAPDSLFCHKCGKPQRDVAFEAVTEAAPPPPPPPAAPPQPAPPNFHNPVAVRIAFVVALATALLSWLPVLNIVMWAGAGFFAVFLYRRRTGYLLTVRAGVQMGWITGVMSFAITIVLFTATILPTALSGGMGALFQAQFKNITDPNMQEALRMFETGPGLAFMLVFTLFMLFVFICALSIAGGALGAKVIGHD